MLKEAWLPGGYPMFQLVREMSGPAITCSGIVALVFVLAAIGPRAHFRAHSGSRCGTGGMARPVRGSGGRKGRGSLVAYAAGAAVLLRSHLGRTAPTVVPALVPSLSGFLVLWRFRIRARRMRELSQPIGQLAVANRLAALVQPTGASPNGGRQARFGRSVHELALLAGLDPAEAAELRTASSFCHVGWLAVPDNILHKITPLDESEQRLLCRAPVIGARLLAGSGSRLLDRAAEMALGHEEKWDGSGYPRGLSGTQIPLSARIAAIATRFDALLPCGSDIEPALLDAVIACLGAEAGQSLDPNLTARFLGLVRRAASADRLHGLAACEQDEESEMMSSPVHGIETRAGVAPAVPCGPVLP